MSFHIASILWLLAFILTASVLNARRFPNVGTMLLVILPVAAVFDGVFWLLAMGLA